MGTRWSPNQVGPLASKLLFAYKLQTFPYAGWVMPHLDLGRSDKRIVQEFINGFQG